MNKEEVLNVFLLANIPEIITQEEFDNVQSAIKELMKENQELKRQQKEFVEYLESEIKRLENTGFYIESIQKAAIKTLEHNLSKYRSIIGSDKSE